MKRKLRPFVDKTKGADVEVNGAASSSSPLKNRNRRSSKLDAPSKNKTTVESTTRVNKSKQILSKNQRLLLILLSILPNPYLVVVPNKNYEYREDFYA